MTWLVKSFSSDAASELPFLHVLSEKPIMQYIFKKLLIISRFTENMFIQNGKLFSQIGRATVGNPLGSTLAVWFPRMNTKNKFFN